MKYLLLLLLSLSTLSLLAQKTAEQRLADFDELIIQGRFTVDVKYSNKMKAVAVVHSEEVDLDNLTYSYTNKTLKIKYSGSLLDDVDLNITIYANNILYLEAKQGAEIRVEDDFDFKNNPVSLKSDAGGKILIDVSVPAVTAEITKGGSIRITGRAELLDATVKTGGTIGAVNLDASNVNAKVSFGGEIICSATKTLEAEITSGGTINYKGEPTVKEKIRLGGTIEKL
jgi:hypothetical protein